MCGEGSIYTPREYSGRMDLSGWVGLVENVDLKAQIQEKVFANAALQNEIRKSKGNSVDTKFAKPSILEKLVLQPPKNQSVVRQPIAFKSERPNFSKPRESAPAKLHHVNAPSSSRNSKKESYGSNDMAHNYYLEEVKKKTQDKNKNLKYREMPSAKTHHTLSACTPKPKSNNQTSRNWHASKSCEETLKAEKKADHSRNPSLFLDFKHFVCSTCQKCVFNANHDACITKFLKKVNSRAKIQPNKTRNSNKPIDPTSHTQKLGRKIVTGHSFSHNKSSAVHEKTNTPRSCLRWIPTGRIFNIVGLKWVPTRKTFTSSTTKKVKATLKGAWTEKDQIDNILKERRKIPTLAGNPVNEILLKLNLPDNRILKDGMKRRSVKVKELQERCIIKAFQVIKSRKDARPKYELDLTWSKIDKGLAPVAGYLQYMNQRCSGYASLGNHLSLSVNASYHMGLERVCKRATKDNETVLLLTLLIWIINFKLNVNGTVNFVGWLL
nr:hypothetical protein [Tanacetum cinerariifolium]